MVRTSRSHKRWVMVLMVLALLLAVFIPRALGGRRSQRAVEYDEDEDDDDDDDDRESIHDDEVPLSTSSSAVSSNSKPYMVR